MKTINDVLQIEITNHGEGYYRADARVLPGTPPVGVGSSEYEALYDLLSKLIFMSAGNGKYIYWDIVSDKIEQFWNEEIKPSI